MTADTAHLMIVGTNHRTAPLSVRERLHFEKERAVHAARALREHAILDEALVLSTCNRLEIYGASRNPAEAGEKIQQFLAREHRFSPDELRPYTYRHSGLTAIQHGFRVVSSLDSLVVGEPQITGQVKDAYRLAAEGKTLGRTLKHFFNRAFYVAKKIRSETQIGSGAVSVGHAAVSLGKQIFGSLAGKRVLLMGAGEIGERMLEQVANQDLGGLWIANRGTERALELQSRFGGTVIPLSDCSSILEKLDIVLSSLAVSSPFWSKKEIDPFLSSRTEPLFMIDVSVPRSIDPLLNRLEKVYLYNIDDLDAVIFHNQEERLCEARKAESVIREEAEALYREGLDLTLAPTISSLSQKLHEIKDRELEKTLKRYPELPDEAREAFGRCADAIVNKILHMPILHLKAQKDEESKLKHMIDSVSSLFNLD